MSTITLGANVDFGAKELKGSTYKYATAAGGTAASWSTGTANLTTLNAALSTDLFTAVGEICTEVNGKMTGTVMGETDTLAEAGTDVPLERNVWDFVRDVTHPELTSTALNTTTIADSASPKSSIKIGDWTTDHGIYAEILNDGAAGSGTASRFIVYQHNTSGGATALFTITAEA